MAQESMVFDVIIIGGGPAGLSAAIRLKQLAQENAQDLRICLLEKGARIGAHTLSGAVLEPTALNELLPDWQKTDCPINLAVKHDRFMWLTQKRAIKLPTPPQMRNQGNYVISLGLLCRWLAEQAEALGIEIYPGFAASEVLYDDSDQVIGVKTGDMGLDKSGQPGPNYQPGIALRAKQTIFAEGCRGSLTQGLIKKFQLDAERAPQTYGMGVKEVWEVDSAHYQRGEVWHTVGWPLDQYTYGGSFVYHGDSQLVSLGLVVGLDYQNPYLDPFQELQRFKTHPKIKTLLENGKRVAYGARALNEGGYQSIPKLAFAGGCLVGCGAGFMNVPKIKGIHTAMKSAMLAAENVFTLIQDTPADNLCTGYAQQLQNSFVGQELKKARNIRPGFNAGLLPGLINAALETYVFRGKAPWTLQPHVDHNCLKPAAQVKKIEYPAPDNTLTFDKLTSVALTNTMHLEGQPCHLQLNDPQQMIDINFTEYASPETHYCPAGVYEIVKTDDQPKLQINSQNCIHCKVCDIKDPTQNITWVAPIGGDGPNYSAM